MGRKGGNDGKHGKDIHVSVPLGTLLYEVLEEKKVPQENQANPTKKREFYQRFLTDLDEQDKQYVVAKGGSGGLGNKRHRGIGNDESKGNLG